MAKPAPKLLPCRHFSQDGTDHCRICAEKKVVENLQIRAELDAATPSRPDPTSPAGAEPAGVAAASETASRPTITKAGIYDGLSHDDYHNDPIPGGSLSSTGVRMLTDPSCPALYRWETDHREDREVTDAMEFGQAYHTLAFGVGPEIALIPDGVLAKNGATSTTAAKEFIDNARYEGRIPLKAAAIERLEAMVAVLRADPIFAAASKTGKPEQSFFWQDLYGVWCRGRVDWLPDPGKGRLIVPDLKSAETAHPGEFGRVAAKNFGYAQQADWYLRGLRAVGAGDKRSVFVFFPQEKKPPYLVQPIQLDAESMRVGEILNDRALETYARCVETGTWPGYHDGVALASLPHWFIQSVFESE